MVDNIKNPPFSMVLDETKSAIKAALEAGKNVLEIYHNNFEVFTKEDNSPVTIADTTSNKIINEILSESEIPILSEENKDDFKRLNYERIWIVDPLDGTSEFVKKNDEFTIMIGLVKNQKPVLGLIYLPVQNFLYIAQKDQGVFRYTNDLWEKIHVSSLNKLEECRLVSNHSNLSQRDKEFLKTLNLTNVIESGSSLKVLKICYGEAELYFTTNSEKIKQWDTCAFNCIITESGGKMSDMFGNEILYNVKESNHENGVLVTNGKIHNQIIKKINHC